MIAATKYTRWSQECLLAHAIDRFIIAPMVEISKFQPLLIPMAEMSEFKFLDQTVEKFPFFPTQRIPSFQSPREIHLLSFSKRKETKKGTKFQSFWFFPAALMK